MEIYEKIKLGNNEYFIKIETKYKKKHGVNMLCLKNYKDDYYDGGDLHALIENLESNYDLNKTLKKYNVNISYIAVGLYIYDHIPFIAGYGDIYRDKNGNVRSQGYLSKKELKKFVKVNNIKLYRNKKFCLCNQRTWSFK